MYAPVCAYRGMEMSAVKVFPLLVIAPAVLVACVTALLGVLTQRLRCLRHRRSTVTSPDTSDHPAAACLLCCRPPPPRPRPRRGVIDRRQKSVRVSEPPPAGSQSTHSVTHSQHHHHHQQQQQLQLQQGVVFIIKHSLLYVR